MAGVEQADAVARHWPLQLGPLGSGNHVIEVSLDETGQVWAFLHSIDQVMADAADLVEVRHTLRQVVNAKGD